MPSSDNFEIELRRWKVHCEKIKERSFSCLRQIHTWLRTTITSDRLGNLGVIGMQGFNYEISIEIML